MLTFFATCINCSSSYEDTDDNDIKDTCPKCIQEFERSKESSKLKELRKLVSEKKNIAVISPAGSGKSYSLKRIEQQIKEHDPPLYYDILCPTGNSAINVNGITFHTLFCWQQRGNFGLFFGMNPKTIIEAEDDYIYNKLQNNRFKSSFKRIQNLDVIIID